MAGRPDEPRSHDTAKAGEQAREIDQPGSDAVAAESPALPRSAAPRTGGTAPVPPRVPTPSVSQPEPPPAPAPFADEGVAEESLPSAGDVGFDADPIAEDYPDPLAGDDPPLEDFGQGATPFDDDYRSAYEEEDENDDEGEGSHFEYRAPFTTRRNPVRMWSIAAGVFALMAAGTIAAVNLYGLPAGLPFNQPTFGIGKPDLVLDFPEAQQREETLSTGVEIFRVRGRITNAGSASSAVPRLIVVFQDERGREVFSKIIVPAKSQLAAGESLNVTEAVSDYPANAYKAKLGWAPY